MVNIDYSEVKTNYLFSCFTKVDRFVCPKFDCVRFDCSSGITNRWIGLIPDNCLVASDACRCLYSATVIWVPLCSVTMWLSFALLIWYWSVDWAFALGIGICFVIWVNFIEEFTRLPVALDDEASVDFGIRFGFWFSCDVMVRTSDLSLHSDVDSTDLSLAWVVKWKKLL